jgi:hypothetical protein
MRYTIYVLQFELHLKKLEKFEIRSFRDVQTRKHLLLGDGVSRSPYETTLCCLALVIFSVIFFSGLLENSLVGHSS